MKTMVLITVILVIVGMQAPALAGSIFTPAIADKPLVPIEQPAPSWTAAVRGHETAVVPSSMLVLPEKPVIANSFISRPIEPKTSSWYVKDRPVYMANYIKTVEEAKILNPDVRKFYSRNLQATDVPEPGSVMGLSAGLFGLIFQTKRMRRRK